MGNDSKSDASIAKKFLEDAAFWLKNIATDAVVEVIKREVEKREKQKAVVIEEVEIIPPTHRRKHKHRKAIKYNANKNN